MEHETPAIYGLMAEFDQPERLVAAARRAAEAGYRALNAYAPYPVEGLAEALGQAHTRLPLLVLVGGALGGAAGYLLQLWTMAFDYPLNIGGRPLNSWPAFIPVTFECIILGAALAAVFGMLGLNGLPMPYHPLFNVERFALASRDRFFLAIRAIDPKFDLGETRRFLESTGAREVTEVQQ